PANDSESFLLNLQKNSGAVSMVNKADLQNNFAINVKDMFDFAPGVLAQVKTGQEARLSIRGSGLSRNFHLRGINLYQDGVPINLVDGSGDFQDIDPLAFDHLEIFKGAIGFHLGSASLG
ncbi:MAG: TonB-dependent receptor plug domain-containing protein, partial [Alphaproteobacteria bacterium]